jgi:hypothetical protein
MSVDPLRVLEFVAVLGAATGVLHRWVVKPIADGLHKAAEESRQLRLLVADVADIRGELRRNGGTSLKDAVVRIEDGMNELKHRFDSHIDLHLTEGRDER